MTADTMARPIDWNGHLPAEDPPEYVPEDDDWYASQRAAYLPDDCNPPY